MASKEYWEELIARIEATPDDVLVSDLERIMEETARNRAEKARNEGLGL
jgi:hypothetical protein